MTTDRELDHLLRRHNRASFGKAATAALMSLFAWVLVPAFVCTVWFLYSRIFVGRSSLPPTLLWTLVYPALNAPVFLWRVLFRSELNYDAHGGIWTLVFWPAYLTAEAITQWRTTERFSPGDRALAQSLMLRSHAAGPNGIPHPPAGREQKIVERLEALGAVRVLHTGSLRVIRRDPDAPGGMAGPLLKSDMPPIGLIAGGGQLPLLEARGMRAAGRRIIGIGLAGQYDPALPELCDFFAEISPLRPGSWARRLRHHGAFEAVMVGHVQKTRLYNPWDILRNCPDLTALHLLFVKMRHDRRSQGLLGALADTLLEKGLLLVSTTDHIPDHLATRGPMTRRSPSEDQLRDIRFALPVLRGLNELDIGQGLCVKGGDVIALEAMEGTDRMIARAGELCRRGGWTLVKGCDATKDLRFDVPTIGVATIGNLKAAGAGCLAVVAGRTIFVDKPAVLAAAEKAGIAVFGVELE